jgi:hypothetical protein
LPNSDQGLFAQSFFFSPETLLAPHEPTSKATSVSKLAGALLPAQFSPLLELFDERLARAKYGKGEPTEGDYEESLQLFGLLVAALQKEGQLVG